MGQRKLVCGGLLIAEAGVPPLKNGAVLTEGGTVAAVGMKDELLAAAGGAEVVECGGAALIPGLVDCHNHLSLDVTLDNYLFRMNDSESELTLRAVQTLAVDLRSGMTTSRCMGDRHFIDVACRKAIDEGRLAGPRLVVATRGIRASHGHGFVGLPFDGAEAWRCAIRENLKNGADLIKFYATGTVRTGERITCFPSREEVMTLAEEARRAGVKTAVHCIGGPGFALCLEAGIDSIEHGYYLTDGEIAMLKQAHAWLVLTPGEFLADKPTLDAQRREAFRRGREEVKERLAAIVASGVKYAVGTDGAHGRLAHELEYIVAAGAKPAEALRAATLHGAMVCGLERRVGSLAPGKAADIVALAGNPLEDIRAVAQVRMVMKAGEIVYGGTA